MTSRPVRATAGTGSVSTASRIAYGRGRMHTSIPEGVTPAGTFVPCEHAWRPSEREGSAGTLGGRPPGTASAPCGQNRREPGDGEVMAEAGGTTGRAGAARPWPRALAESVTKKRHGPAEKAEVGNQPSLRPSEEPPD